MSTDTSQREHSPVTRTRAFPPGTRRRSILVGAVALVAFVFAWYLASTVFGLLNPLLLPSPQAVAWQFIHLLSTDYLGNTLLGHALASLKIVFMGWLLGGIVGAPLGILMGWSRWVRAVISPVFQLIRPISPIAWIPISILWFGLGDSSRIYVVWIAAVVPWVLNSFEAVKSVDSILISAGRILGAPRRIILGEIVVPTSASILIAGARISLGNAWMTLIAAELLGASAGLGYIALNAQRTLDSDIVLVAMGTIGVLGVVFTALLSLLERAVSKGRSDNPGST